ncbi:MAG: AI-2E family transporter [Arcobacter sp.]|nr:MAG: AI-2E family transporter [Arcobacter sp.]
MQEKIISSSPLVKVAAVVIIIAGLIAAKSIVIPILLAIFITILTSPLLIWLQDKGLHSGLSLVSIMVVLIFILGMLGILVSSSLNDFMANLPLYEDKFRESMGSILKFFHDNGFEFSDESISSFVDPSKMAAFASGIIKGFGAALTNSFMILLLVVFMLLEASVLPKKLQTIHADASSHAREFIDNVKQYMKIKSIFSFITGFIIYLAMLAIGLDYALLWGVLAFMLNFVPNIGSIIAAVPAVLLALIQLGFLGGLEVGTVFMLVNIILGSILEPKYMGKGLGLSTLVVFLSLLFWGWVFGPVGMLLSIPLTIMLKLALQTNLQTQWIAVLLGSSDK